MVFYFICYLVVKCYLGFCKRGNIYSIFDIDSFNIYFYYNRFNLILFIYILSGKVFIIYKKYEIKGVLFLEKII